MLMLACLVDQIIAGDPQTDPAVQKTLKSVLKGFHQQYKEDRSMRVYAEWWDAIGGARGVRLAGPAQHTSKKAR